jgi:iron complex transport system substrate-binding protein
VRWLAAILYHKQFPESLQDTTRQFYKLFCQVDLTDEQIAMLLTTATSKRER